MALPPLEEQRGAQRDGTAQAERRRAELAAGAIGIDERGPADLLRFARRFASRLLWHGPDNRPAGWWGPPEPGAAPVVAAPDEPLPGGPGFFDGIGGGPAAGLSLDEVAAFIADPAAFPGDRFDVLRRPHMALFLTSIGLMQHGQRVLNVLTDNHVDYQLRDVLGLAPRAAVPDRAYVLFELAAGIAAAEAVAGLRLLAGRDAGQSDRVYTLEDGLIVNRARIADLRSSFVEREVIGLAEARRAITGTPEEQFLFMLAIALGDPRPGDPLPLLGGQPVTHARLAAIGQLIGFAPLALFMELFELRALLARKAGRANEAAEWTRINKFIEIAGRAKRGDPAWTLATANPRDFAGNLAIALGGPPDLGGLTEVETVDDLALHIDRADVRAMIRAKLFLDPDRQFRPMIALKRGIDADWRIINNYLERAGRRKRPAEPGWTLPVGDAANFAGNLAAAIGAIDFAAAGPEAAGIGDLDSYLTRIEGAEAFFFLAAESIARLVATFGADDATPAGAAAWRDAAALLEAAHGRKVRATGAAAMRRLREAAATGSDGLVVALAAALGDLPADVDGRMEALGRFATPDEVALVRAALAGAGAGAGARRRASDWDRIDAILEAARRQRLRLPEPAAQKRHWRALWAYPDARQALATTTDAAGESVAWRSFGDVPPDAGPERPPASLGWALASPALALSTGRRKITITLGFHADGGGPLLAPVDDHGDSAFKRPFDIRLSGAKAWIKPTSVSFVERGFSSLLGMEPVDAATPLIGLQIEVTLDETLPAPAPSDATAAFGNTAWPVLELLLRPVWDPVVRRFDTAYERFAGLRLARVHVEAAAGRLAGGAGAPGLWPLTIETDAGVANGKKPFEPFGSSPSIGSELAFSHADLANKRLFAIGIGLEWMGGPSNLDAHYLHYEPRDFKAQLSLVEGGVRTTPLGEPTMVFAKADSNVAVRIGRTLGEAGTADRVVAPMPPEVRSWRRYLTLRLSGTDFGHRTYPGLVTAKSIALANELRKGTNVNPADYVVNAPWTPKLKRIAIDLIAVHEIDVGRYDRATAIDRLFHVHAFGAVEAGATAGAPAGATAEIASGWPLLPVHDEEGALYIGLAGVEAPQSLALLFAAVESAGAAARPGRLRWRYLDAGGWTDFAEPPEDGTEGLIRRGIVRFALPPAAGDGRMPGGLYWLQATIAEAAGNACDLVDIHPHAGSARFFDAGAAPEHWLAPLPAGTIRSLGDAAPGIARVVQPYASEGGRGPEADLDFRTRAGERLRHKGRAVTLWDYERLVLDQFPEVHKVKCLPARLAEAGPGAVRVVIIPDIRGQVRSDPLAPRAPARLLDAIADYLAPLMPPTARLVVGHPVFVEVRVRVGVRFRPGGDEAFDKRRLTERLNRYLAPWAFDEGSDIAIGQRIDATSIVAFIDQLPFVDFVGGCRLFTRETGGPFRPGADGGEAVEVAREDGVLTPASSHEIDIIADDAFVPEDFSGVGYMKIELDFVVG